MKQSLKYLTAAAALAAAVAINTSAFAATYTDSTGDTFAGVGGGGILDIVSAEVSNDATDVIVKINFNADIVATDWGNYMIGIDVDGMGAGTGDTNGNAWGRPITMSYGMDYWVGGWVNGGGGRQLWDYEESTNNWNQVNQTSVTIGTSNVTYKFAFSQLGLTIGDDFDFDIYSSGSGPGDGAIDALANPNETIGAWGDSYDSSTNATVTYTLLDAPTNMVTFLVDMEAEIADGNFVPGDALWVRGSFNGWLDPDPTLSTNSPSSWLLVQDTGDTLGFGTNVWFGTFEVTGFNGKTDDYKYWSIFTTDYGTGGYEYTMMSCGANRMLTITNQGGAQTLPLDFFSQRTVSDPTTLVTFQVDMSVQAEVGNFDTNSDVVYCRGNFTGWSATFLLTNDFGGANPLLYSGSTNFTVPCNACFEYKYNINGDDAKYEGISNRQLLIDCTNGVLPVVFFDNVSGSCDFVTDATNYVTFTVDLSQAVDTISNAVYDGSWDVYINGEFLGWPGWDTASLAAYQLTQIGGTSNFSITLPFAPGEELRMTYKYGANTGNPNALDNEGGFGEDHVRWIRTTPGQTNYSVSDVWTGTNAQNIANLQEDQLSIGINPGTAGTVDVDWEGLRCAELQSASVITGPWTTIGGAAGISSTNVSTAGGQEYFRLTQP